MSGTISPSWVNCIALSGLSSIFLVPPLSVASLDLSMLWLATVAAIVIQIGIPLALFRDLPWRRRVAYADRREAEYLGAVAGRFMGPRWLLCFAIYGVAFANTWGRRSPLVEDTHFVVQEKETSQEWIIIRSWEAVLVLAALKRGRTVLDGRYQLVAHDRLAEHYGAIELKRKGRLTGHPRAPVF